MINYSVLDDHQLPIPQRKFQRPPAASLPSLASLAYLVLTLAPLAVIILNLLPLISQFDLKMELL